MDQPFIRHNDRPSSGTAEVTDFTLSPTAQSAVDLFFAAHINASNRDAAKPISPDSDTQIQLDRVGQWMQLLDHDSPDGLTHAEMDQALVQRTVRQCLAQGRITKVKPSPIAPADAEVLDAILAAHSSQALSSTASEALPDQTSHINLDHLGPLPADSRPQAEKIASLLNLLSDDPAEADTSTDLVQRTLERCREARQRERFSQQVAMFAAGPAPRRPWLRQLSVAAGIVLVALSLLLPALSHNEQVASRIACASNLSLAGSAFQRYAADNRDQLPRAPMQEGDTWWNVGQAQPNGVVRSNSAHLYILVRQGYIKADDLTCPTNPHANDVKMTTAHHDWTSPEQVSFSFHNVSSGRIVKLAGSPNLALLADKNPLFIVRAGKVTFDHQADVSTPSRAHNNAGQNVLKANGVVVWTTRPTIRKSLFSDDDQSSLSALPGRESMTDNIWVASGVDQYDGDESPASVHDSFLVP